MMILPFVLGMAIKILTKPESVGISISGAQIYLKIPFPIQNFILTEAQVNSWLVMISIAGICLYLTHGISEKGGLKRQVLAEWAVEACESLCAVIWVNISEALLLSSGQFWDFQHFRACRHFSDSFRRRQT